MQFHSEGIKINGSVEAGSEDVNKFDKYPE